MSRPDSHGIGVLSAIILIGMTAALVAASIPVVNQVSLAAKTLKTRTDLDELKAALAGNPNLVIEGGRADFGYIGTMGQVPPALSDLWLRGSQNTYSFDAVALVGGGWVGPYAPNPIVEELLALDNDPFGNPFVYTATPFNRPSDGAEVAARILSVGPDGTEGTSDDLLVDVLSAEIFSTVNGTLFRNNQVAPFASVTLNVPINGVVDTRVAATDAGGEFSFDDVPYGFRSLSIDPLLTYEAGTAKLQGTRLRFTVTNFGENNLQVTSMAATYGVAAYYQEIRFGNSTVFNYTNAPYNGTRAASGQTITFSSPQTVAGSGKPSQVIPIRVEQEITDAPDLQILGVGKSVVVELRDFRDTISGSSSAVDVTGVEFTINFNDGSVNTFTVP